jgi:hypothetical protein
MVQARIARSCGTFAGADSASGGRQRRVSFTLVESLALLVVSARKSC